MNILKVAAVLILLLASTHNLYAQGLEAGYVQQMQGSADNYLLQRHGEKPRPLMLLDVLYAGDTITINKPLLVRLQLLLLLDGKQVKLTHRDSLFHVPVPKGSASIASNLLNILRKSLSGMHAHYIETVAMVSRGGKYGSRPPAPLALPPLLTQGGIMQAQERALVLQWSGGVPPYRITLFKNTQRIVQQEKRKRLAHLSPYRFTAGDYRFEVEDSDHAKVTGHFTVISDTVPTLPSEDQEELAASVLSPEMKTTLRMAWLVEHNPTWKLEAYQQLCPAKNEYVTKVLCAEMLLSDDGVLK